MSSDPIRIVLVDDHKIVREGTRQLLEDAADFKIVGEADDGEQALSVVAALQPDVVVMDIRLPKLNGIEATRRIKEKLPFMHILILSAYEDDCYVFPLLEAGAEGYLLKTSSAHELQNAIRAVMKGETVLDPHVAHKVIQRMSRKQLYRSENMCEGLTERELEVLRTAALGKSNKEIASILCISVGTVQVHFRNIFNKMNVSGRTEAVTFAMSQGWITPAEYHAG